MEEKILELELEKSKVSVSHILHLIATLLTGFWGLIWIKSVLNFKETDIQKKKYSLLDIFSFMIIEKDLVAIYDTRQDIVLGKLPPLRHEDRYCEFFDTVGHACYKKAHVIKHS